MRRQIDRTWHGTPPPLVQHRSLEVCRCLGEALHNLIHPHLPFAGPPAHLTADDIPDAIYDTCPEALDPDAGMGREYHGPPAGMDRRHKGALGAPRPLCAPHVPDLPIDAHRPYFRREDIALLDAHLPLSPLAKCLYSVLGTFYNWLTRACFPSRATLAARLADLWGAPVSDHAFRKALDELRGAGLISWDKGGTHHSNRYRFHLIETLVRLGLATWDAIATALTQPPPTPDTVRSAKSPSNREWLGRDSFLAVCKERITNTPSSLLLGETPRTVDSDTAWRAILSPVQWVWDRMRALDPTPLPVQPAGGFF